jgi:hypothetical protein
MRRNVAIWCSCQVIGAAPGKLRCPAARLRAITSAGWKEPPPPYVISEDSLEEGSMDQPKLKYLITGMMAAGALAFAPAVHAGHDKGGPGQEFQMMDTDGDGKLSPEEHAAGAKKMFDMMDADKDGMVNAEEMEAAHEKMMGKKGKEKGHMSAAEKIKVVDTDGNGTLSAAEHEAGAKMMFEKMDTNKDGYLTKSELSAGHAKMMKKPAK